MTTAQLILLRAEIAMWGASAISAAWFGSGQMLLGGAFGLIAFGAWLVAWSQERKQ